MYRRDISDEFRYRDSVSVFELIDLSNRLAAGTQTKRTLGGRLILGEGLFADVDECSSAIGDRCRRASSWLIRFARLRDAVVVGGRTIGGAS